MGVFVYCLNAGTGEVVWINDGTLEDGASRDTRVAHRPYEACPGGYMTIAEDKLLLPAGRRYHTCYDLKTGNRVLYEYEYAVVATGEPGKEFCASGGIVAAAGRWFIGSGNNSETRWCAIFDPARGRTVGYVNGIPAVDGNVAYAVSSGELAAFDFAGRTFEKGYGPGACGGFSEIKGPFAAAWTTQGAKAQHNPIKIGSGLYYGAWISSGKRGGVSRLSAVRIPAAGGKPETVWQTTVEGQNPVVLAAAGKLFVTTTSGDVMCFGDKPGEVRRWPLAEPPPATQGAQPDPATETMLNAVGHAGGYVLVLGIESGKLVESLLQGTDRQLVVLDPDPGKVATFRAWMHAAGRYGPRVTALVGDIRTAGLPPFFAEAVVSETAGFCRGADAAETVAATYRSLRPFGGRLCVAPDPAGYARFEAACAAARLAGSKLTREGALAVLTRADLPGATGAWENAYGGDAAKTLASPDALIKPPLGLLWFGGDGSSNELYGRLERTSRVLCAHGGRVFTFNASRVYALDAYTGRIVWNVPGAGYAREDKQQGFAFFNPAVDAAGLYVSNGRTIAEHVPSTGAVSRQIPIPAEWGLGTVGNILLRGEHLLIHSESAVVCISRKEGKALWTRQAAEKKMLGRVVLGGDRAFFAEGVGVSENLNTPRKAGPGELEAVNLADGRTVWRVPLDWFPTYLVYSEKAGLVLASLSAASIDARSAADGRRVWTGKPSPRKPMWDYDYVKGPTLTPAWNGRLFLPGGQIVDAATGAPAVASHPLTGLPVPWNLPYKGWGCSLPNIAGDLFFTRGFDTVYFDLANGGDMTRLDGFRLACAWSLMPSAGVLAALNVTQFGSCGCSNPIMSPVGLVHDPDVEVWTTSAFESPTKEPIARVGINLGAPGDRRAPDGTLWIDYPVAAFQAYVTYPNPAKPASAGPQLPVEVTPSDVRWFRHHSLRMKGEGLKWVAASGARGIRSLKVTLPAPATNAYTVRLVFAEPDQGKAGERVFDVAIQGQRVIEKLDIVAAAGAPLTVLTREFRNIRPGAALTVELTPVKGEPVLSGVELVADPAERSP
jgi:outer membrane protein assembly factor BamB